MTNTKGVKKNMKIGVCAGTQRIELLSELKYDYFEVNFSWLASLDEEELKKHTAIVEKYGLASESGNGFFASDVQIYDLIGDQSQQLAAVEAYAKRGFERFAAWGGKVSVIGSGNARALHDGMTAAQADEQFSRVLNVCGEAADKYGIRVAVEPLSVKECNYLHTVADGAKVAAMSGNAAVGVIVDFYHHANNNDSIEDLPKYADRLLHAHYARPFDRKTPREENREHLLLCASALKKCPKVERISLECSWEKDYEADVRAAREMMKVFADV